MTSTTRRRGEKLERAILAAAWEELLERGWEGFSVPRIAARAGTGKASIYSRWPTRAALAVGAAVHHAVTDVAPRVPTGSLRGDLLALLLDYCAFLDGPSGGALRALASDPAAAEHAPSAGDDQAPPIKPMLEIVATGRAAGELGRSPIRPIVTHLGPALVNEHFLRRGRTPTTVTLEEVVDAVWQPLLVADSNGS